MNEAGSSQSEEGFVPSAKEATELVTKFAEVTGTDTVRHRTISLSRILLHTNIIDIMYFLN